MKQFRQDLFYRLDIFVITIPALRDRTEDILALLRHFVEIENGKRPHKRSFVEEGLIGRLQKYHWPGNIREFEHAVTRAMVFGMSTGDVLCISDFYKLWESTSVQMPVSSGDLVVLGGLDGVKKTTILRVLQETNGNRTHAAKQLGISIRTLRNRLREWRAEGTDIIPPSLVR